MSKNYKFYSSDSSINEYDFLKEHCTFVFEFTSLIKHDINLYPENIRVYMSDIYRKSRFLFEDDCKKVFFDFNSDSFSCKLTTTEDYSLILNRNDKEVILNFKDILKYTDESFALYEDNTTSSIYIMASLFPNKLSLQVYNTAHKSIETNLDDSSFFKGFKLLKDEILDNFKIDNFIAKEIRQNAIVKRIEYKDEIELIMNIKKIMASLNDTLYKVGGASTFWLHDNTPKKEVQAQEVIKLMLSSLINLTGLELHVESACASGRVDFYISGVVTGKGMFGVCVELKLAHSPDIRNGMINQLPEYMKRKNASHGIYLVLYYNSNHKAYENYVNEYSVVDGLNSLRFNPKYQHDLKNIYAYVLDVSIPISASKINK